MSSQPFALELSSGCDSEQLAAGELGFTQATWDAKSSSTLTAWGGMTHSERAAAVKLGFTKATWGKTELTKLQNNKSWAKLTVCGASATQPLVCAFVPPGIRR